MFLLFIDGQKVSMFRTMSRKRRAVPELKEALTPQYLLTLAMIHVGMVMGIILFGAVTLFLLLVAVTFPTRDRLESLLQDQRLELR